MSWNDYGGTNSSGPNRRNVAIAGAAVAGVLVLVVTAIVVLSAGSHVVKDAKSTGTTSSTVVASTTTSTGVPQEDLNAASEGVADAAALDQLYGATTTGTDPGVARNLGDLAAQVVRADTTGEGRDQFRDYFGNGRFSPTATSMTIDYSIGQKIDYQPDPRLYRGVVVWHGTDTNGDAYKQVRRSVYFILEGGRFSPVPFDQLPDDIVSNDTLILGQIIR